MLSILLTKGYMARKQQSQDVVSSIGKDVGKLDLHTLLMLSPILECNLKTLSGVIYALSYFLTIPLLQVYPTENFTQIYNDMQPQIFITALSVFIARKWINKVYYSWYIYHIYNRTLHIDQKQDRFQNIILSKVKFIAHNYSVIFQYTQRQFLIVCLFILVQQEMKDGS